MKMSLSTSNRLATIFNKKNQDRKYNVYNDNTTSSWEDAPSPPPVFFLFKKVFTSKNCYKDGNNGVHNVVELRDIDKYGLSDATPFHSISKEKEIIRMLMKLHNKHYFQ